MRRKKVGKFTKLFDEVTAVLPARSGDILRRRFGMVPGQARTLDGVGKHYGLTRERIRQIIAAAIKHVKKNLTPAMKRKIYQSLENKLKKSGHIMPEEDLIKSFAGDDPVEAGAIKFFIEIAENIDRFRHREAPGAVVHVEFNQRQWELVKDVIKEILSEVNESLPHAHLHEKYLSHQKADKDIDPEKLRCYLEPVKDVKRNPFGRWGLAHWPEVEPKAIKEKIYLVLKEHKEPLHFSEIAERIDRHGLSKKPGERTNVQTVHNELIKDPRFILIGRGRYALEDWGYEPGTVKDIIERIMERAGRPMSLREVVREVLKLRDVKETTVVVNLNAYFKKVRRGVYTLPDNGKK